MKVLVSDTFSAAGLKIFEQAEGIEVAYLPGLSNAELLEAAADVEGLVVRGGSQLDEALFAAAGKLKVVCRAGIGLENIDLDAASRRGVVVMNTPFGTTTTTAEHTIAMLMALARQLPLASASVKAGEWDRHRFLGVEIAGKTMGVIGAGRIGRLVVERARCLKMQVIVYDPYLTAEMVHQMGAEQVEFDELLTRCDFLALHIPRTQETENLLDAEAFARIKPGCRIINCARGGLIDEAALAEAIGNGRVAGAALDVFAQEPPAADHPLLGLDQVILTPHLCASTVDAQTNVAVQAAEQIVDFLQKGTIRNGVNVPSVSADVLATIRPYLFLAERLGSFQAQVSTRGLQRVIIEFAGSAADLPTGQISLALLKGLLTPMVGDIVNFVNAPHLARERGITILETKSHTTDGFANLIRLTVESAEKTSSVCGAVFSEQDIRIVQIDGYPVEAPPEGHLLVVHSDDRPGVIGFLGQSLADAGINIAMMNLSRRKLKGRAVSLITVDNRIPDKMLEQLKDNPHIFSAIQVEL